MRAFHLLLAAAAFTCAGCVTVRASTSPGADLGRYRTFAFHQSSHARQMGTQAPTPASQAIRQEVERALVAKGLTEDAQNPDFLVAYHLVLREQYDVSEWGYGFGWWGGPAAIDSYVEGTIVVDFIDPRTNQTFWRGSAASVVDHPMNPNPQKIAQAVDKMMSKYPGQVASTAPPRM